MDQLQALSTAMKQAPAPLHVCAHLYNAVRVLQRNQQRCCGGRVTIGHQGQALTEHHLQHSTAARPRSSQQNTGTPGIQYAGQPAPLPNTQHGSRGNGWQQ